MVFSPEYPLVPLTRLFRFVLTAVALLPPATQAQSSPPKVPVPSEPVAPAGGSPAKGEESWEIIPAPDWITPIEPDLSSPTPYRSDISEGLYFRLVDMQAHAEKQELYQRFVDEYCTLAGVHDNGSVQIDFSPAFQHLHIHHFRLIHGGKSEDILPRLDFRLINSESEIDAGQFNGRKALHILLTGIGQGDVLDYAYTVVGDNPAFAGHYCDRIPMRWGSPVGHLRFRLVKKTDRPVHWLDLGIGITPMELPLPGGETEILWEQHQVPAVIVEPTLPDWYRPYPMLHLSDFTDWKEVAAWGAPLYASESKPVPANVASIAAAIREKHPDADGRALAAIRYVQDEIRYLGLEDGVGAYQPKDPMVTCDLLFGDCKDKTLLLRTLLGALGIPSEPVFVSTTRRRHITDDLPSPLAFDHVILRLMREGKPPVYVDATQNLGGGDLDAVTVTDFGKGLPVTEDSPGLADLPVPRPEKNAVLSQEDWEIRQDGIARLVTTTTYTGSEAEEQRYYLQGIHPDRLHADYLEYYRDHHPDIQPDGQVEIQDDREANELVVVERYHLEKAWTADASDPDYSFIRFYLNLLSDPLAQPKNPDRKMPYATMHPLDYTQIVRVRLPGPSEDWEFEEEHHHIEAGPLAFSRDITYEDSVLTIQGKLDSGDDHVVPEKAREFRDRLDDIGEMCSYALWNNVPEDQTYDPTGQVDATAAEGIDDSETVLANMLAGGFFGVIIGLVAGAGLTLLIVLLVRRPPPPKPPWQGPPPPPIPPYGQYR